MKRFAFELDAELHAAFLRAFPDHGSRTQVLRKCVRRLVKRVKESGRAVDRDVMEVADKVADDYGC